LIGIVHLGCVETWDCQVLLWRVALARQRVASVGHPSVVLHYHSHEYDEAPTSPHQILASVVSCSVACRQEALQPGRLDSHPAEKKQDPAPEGKVTCLLVACLPVACLLDTLAAPACKVACLRVACRSVACPRVACRLVACLQFCPMMRTYRACLQTLP